MSDDNTQRSPLGAYHLMMRGKYAALHRNERIGICRHNAKRVIHAVGVGANAFVAHPGD